MANEAKKLVKTVKVKVKDRHFAFLNKCARDVNLVWNFCNELDQKTFKTIESKQLKDKYIFYPKKLRKWDISKYTAGLSKLEEIAIPSASIEAVSDEFYTRREQAHKKRKTLPTPTYAPLKWRGRFSRGWIPFKAKNISITDKKEPIQNGVKFAGKIIQFRDRRIV